jgi:drug/metabolite transporter (DMT)-like permease
MAKKSNFQSIFVLGLISGTFNSIVIKLCYQTASMSDVDGDAHFFHKPWFMSLLMFAAMLCALPLYYIFSPKPISLNTWLIVSIPSACDLLGSSMQQVGLIFTPVSIYQMLKGSILLFSAALSVWFLNKRMYLHNWVGVLLCVVALTLVGISSVMSIDEQPIVVSLWESVFGISIVVLGQVVCAS